MSQHNFVLSPVGYIHTGSEGFVLEIEPRFRPAMNGLEGFSHINILWWSHYLDSQDQRGVLTCQQPYRNAPSELGVFATRSPQRPNPVCLSIAQVIRIDNQQGKIYVAYLDAEDGTPILDIKPYTPSIDRIREVKTPDWNRHWPQWFEDSAEFDWEAEFVNAR